MGETAPVKIRPMLLESLEAHCFRNLSGKASWGAGLNILYGDNGQGKTNWLEANPSALRDRKRQFVSMRS